MNIKNKEIVYIKLLKVKCVPLVNTPLREALRAIESFFYETFVPKKKKKII